jgi:lysophospholipase L1-like esterase
MVTPFRTILLLFYVACAIIILMVLSPGEIPISENFTLKVFTFKDFTGADTATVVNEERMADLNAMARQLDSLEQTEKKAQKGLVNPDSLSLPTAGTPLATSGERPEPVIDPKYPIQFPDSLNPTALDPIFAAWAGLSQQPSLVRIVHYGDSQIEGDRISDYIRSRLQRKFGGCGVGIVPFLELQASRSTIATEASGNWSKYAIYGNNNKSNKTGHYGVLAAAYRFSPLAPKDSLAPAQLAWRATSRFRETRFSDDFANATQVENIKFIYASPFAKVAAHIKMDGLPQDTTLDIALQQERNVSVVEQAVPGRFKKLSISLESAEGSEFFGVALDCNQGIALDNVAMRGSSGIEFTKMNAEWLRRQYDLLNVKLIILQFGVNVVPNVLRDYTFYENMLYKQLRFFKSVAPQAAILVVGLSDMARRSGTGYASYPNVPKIRNAQRAAAFRAGCAFWDLYEAMGGEGAMISWVNNKPPLAGKDYTHFTPRGARLVGEMLYNALMKEYENYKIRNRIAQ